MIASLSYIGFRSPNASEWTDFGANVLGAQVAAAGADGAVRLRVDESEARIIIHPGEAEQLAYLGWDVGGPNAMATARDRLAAAGVTVTDDDDAAAVRQVAALHTFTDPFGFRHELSYGLADGGPFEPGRPITGFVTGEGGLGHVVLIVPDLDLGTTFYCDVLGFRQSDDVDDGNIHVRFLHCNPRHHSLAIGSAPGLVGVHHLMLEVGSIDDVGSGLDIVNERAIPLAMSLGRHTNDLMTSFYVRTPSGFEIEYGTGGLVVDDATWETTVHDSQSIWGHKPPAAGPLFPKILAPVQSDQ